MKREILFRGQRKNKEWMYGDLLEYNGKTQIIQHHFDGKWSIERNDVVPETVGQFTGLTDKNGVKIFEGDIVIPCLTKQKGTVIFKKGMFCFEVNKFHSKLAPLYQSLLTGERAVNEYEIIGNIHDNPELL
ncbi:MAG: YopX family protein [Paludibacter sp.]|nr:YopX family protein [Paludibacter sp.]